MDRKIIHIDMDAFYASIEQRDNPQLNGLPVAVGGEGARSVVAAASYEARRYGVYSAMSSVIAKRKCPQLVFVRPRFSAYKAVSLEIRDIFYEYTDLVEPLSLDEAFLDVTENKMNMPVATEIAKQIKVKIREKTGLTASAGVSVNKFLAKIASDYKKPDGLFVIKPNEAEAFVEQLAVEKFFGIGKVTAEKMHQIGIHTGRDLRAFSLLELTRLFGKSGSFYYNIARAIDDRPVDPERVRKSFGTEYTFDHDLYTIPDILAQLYQVETELLNRLLKSGVRGRTLTLKVKFNDFTQFTRSKSLLDYYTPDLIHLHSIELCSNIELNKKGIRLLGLTISNLEHHDDIDAYQLEIDFK